ncbi:16S rRNA (cytidine(1402)-2'-O)-methyltransferase [bacterium]|nr:16S rRNA (cytidine(1402)-2'-O)-methyltransferase [bacterium]
MTTLYIIATPIGNFSDITFRALQILRSVDLILCEDTRVTRKLLSHFGIKAKTLSFHQHTDTRKLSYILSLLRQGNDLALVCDAGTPGISDPGGKLVEEVVKKLGGKVKISPVPGPSALIAAASISGFPMDRFLFLGFPPQKRKRSKFFEEIIKSKYPVIFYESPYRIIRTLEDISKKGKQPKKDIEIVVCRELTKKFETIYRGTIAQVVEEIKKQGVKTIEHNIYTGNRRESQIKGEFTIVVRQVLCSRKS